MKPATERCVFCGQIVPDKKPTNADRIRAMSDKELAAAIMCPKEICMAEIPCDHDCYQCCLDWLKQEAEEPPKRKCRICGCTDDRACPGGCSWVEPDLCSACARKDVTT